MQKKSIDTTLLFIVIALVIFGMIMISSVSVYPSFKITTRMVSSGLLSESNNYFYLSKNIIHVILGIFSLMIFSKIPYSLYEKYIHHILYTSIALLIGVLIFGVEYNGARGWMSIPGLPSIQPVEFVKIGIILFLAYFLKKKRSLMSSFTDGFIPYFSLGSVFFLLLALQPDFGSILIIAPVITAMYFVGGGNSRYLLLLVISAFLAIATVYSIGKFTHQSSLGYISGRIDNFFQENQLLFEKPNPDGKDYQTKQGLIAIGSGGFFGLGFGKSIQKFGYLPEVQGDFIFSVIAEELGFFGVMILLSLYLTIVYRGFVIARGVKDLFGKYCAFGISMLILIQMFINVGVNLNVVPLTGVTLPFVSYGGSSLISLLVGVGILLNISRSVEYKSKISHDPFLGKRRIRT